ncbi:MAG: hypothetical protein N0C91_13075, partial [Candidatus Thiodiazotropha endolucinida]|nr:hypothetical protein [Candidatus Thiodiazotropha taylori]MCG8121248.1 hypothetical protein [Candidatus Thiodiazotropha taylori]MCW4288634.1 hypothetical protein [Candidatus Thiodiazotropha endolucinida]MCW4296941.1 hypothetical protein [Candidatus Thiodiazotropha endolucinida]
MDIDLAADSLGHLVVGDDEVVKADAVITFEPALYQFLDTLVVLWLASGYVKLADKLPYNLCLTDQMLHIIS